MVVVGKEKPAYCSHCCLYLLAFYITNTYHNDDLLFQEMVVVGKEKPAFNLLWKGCSTAAHSSVRRVSSAVLWETLHSASLCVDAGHNTLVALWRPLMWPSSLQQSLVLSPP